jgi:hypothetical protein
MLFVVVMICSASVPKCDVEHARAYRAYIAPEGFAICSAPAISADLASSPIGPAENEYQRTRCEWRAK